MILDKKGLQLKQTFRPQSIDETSNTKISIKNVVEKVSLLILSQLIYPSGQKKQFNKVIR